MSRNWKVKSRNQKLKQYPTFFECGNVCAEVYVSKRSRANFSAESVFIADTELHGGRKKLPGRNTSFSRPQKRLSYTFMGNRRSSVGSNSRLSWMTFFTINDFRHYSITKMSQILSCNSSLTMKRVYFFIQPWSNSSREWPLT